MLRLPGPPRAASLSWQVATEQHLVYGTPCLRCQRNVVAGLGGTGLQCGGVALSKSRGTWSLCSWRLTIMEDYYRNREVRLVSLKARASSSSKSNAPAAERPAIMVIGLTGKMGRATADAAVAAGLRLVPFTFTGRSATKSDLYIKDVRVQVRDQSEREDVLTEVLKEYPDVIIVDYTVPQAVNEEENIDLPNFRVNNLHPISAKLGHKCQRGVPFVMGTTGGDRVKLNNGVLKSGNYAVIAPQMGKEVVAIQAGMQFAAEQFPGVFSGYELQVTESHQSSKLDTSGTAKAIIASFVKLGVDFDVSKIEKIRDPEQQVQRMKVPEKHLQGHAFHTYKLIAPDNMASFALEHNVCGRSIYGEGTVDAVLFLAKKIEQKTEIKVYNMIDVLREGNMR